MIVIAPTSLRVSSKVELLVRRTLTLRTERPLCLQGLVPGDLVMLFAHTVIFGWVFPTEVSINFPLDRVFVEYTGTSGGREEATIVEGIQGCWVVRGLLNPRSLYSSS